MKLFGGLTYIEMAYLAHMLHSPVYCYDASHVIMYGQLIFLIMLIDPFQKILAKDLFIFILQIVIFK